MKTVVFLVLQESAHGYRYPFQGGFLQREFNLPHYIIGRKEVQKKLQQHEDGIFVIKENNRLKAHRQFIHEATKDIDCTVIAYIQQDGEAESLTAAKAMKLGDEEKVASVEEFQKKIEFRLVDEVGSEDGFEDLGEAESEVLEEEKQESEATKAEAGALKEQKEKLHFEPFDLNNVEDRHFKLARIYEQPRVPSRLLKKFPDEFEMDHNEIVYYCLNLAIMEPPPFGPAADLDVSEALKAAQQIIFFVALFRKFAEPESERCFFSKLETSLDNAFENMPEDRLISKGAFWLSNLFLVISWASQVQRRRFDRMINEKEVNDLDFTPFIVADVSTYAEKLYYLWMKRMRSKLEEEAYQTVLRHQEQQDFGFPSIYRSSEKAWSSSDLLRFFDTLYWSMRSYFIDLETVKTVVWELLLLVDKVWFNYLMRNGDKFDRLDILEDNVNLFDKWTNSHGFIGTAFPFVTGVVLVRGAKGICLYEANFLYLYKDSILLPLQVKRLGSMGMFRSKGYQTFIKLEELDDTEQNEESYVLDSSHQQGKNPFTDQSLAMYSMTKVDVPECVSRSMLQQITQLVAGVAADQEKEINVCERL